MNLGGTPEVFCSKNKLQQKHVYLTAKICAQGAGDMYSLFLCWVIG